jgi:hypothetical protein
VKARKAIGKPGPGGTLIVPANYRPVGRPRGVKGKIPPRTEKQLATLRTNRLKRTFDGLRRKHAVVAGARAEETLSALLDAAEGRFDGLSRLHAGKLARLSVIHDSALDEVEEDGVTTEEEIRDATGNVISSRRRENPALGAALRLGETLGVSAREHLMTPASRGVSKRDESVAAFFDQQARLRSWSESRKPAIPAGKAEDPLEAEIVDDKENE